MTYDTFASTRAAKAAYRRCRTEKYFILTGRESPPCASCGRGVHDFTGLDTDGKLAHPPGFDSNRCVYNPKTKTITARHYTCAWGKTLADVAKRRHA